MYTKATKRYLSYIKDSRMGGKINQTNNKKITSKILLPNVCQMLSDDKKIYDRKETQKKLFIDLKSRP